MNERDREAGAGGGTDAVEARSDGGAEGAADASYEQAHAELEEIVRTLERGDTSLERTLELWERGEQLYALCAARLDAAQGRVEELTRELETQGGDPPDWADDAPTSASPSN